MTTAESVKMASLSGSFDSAVYEADIEDEDFDKSLLQGRYTKQDINALIQTAKPSSIMDTTKRGVDIFLSHEWPVGINKLVGPILPPPTDLPPQYVFTPGRECCVGLAASVSFRS